MGHLINPIASRLGLSTFWSSNAVTLKAQHQTNFALEDIFFQKLFTWFYNFLEKGNFLFTHLIINRLFGKIFFCTIMYNANVDSMLYPFYSTSYSKLALPEIKQSAMKRFFLRIRKAVDPKIKKNSLAFGSNNKKFKNHLFSVKNKRRDRLFFKKYKAFKFLRFYRKFFKRSYISKFFLNSVFFFSKKKNYYFKKNLSLIKYFKKPKKNIFLFKKNRFYVTKKDRQRRKKLNKSNRFKKINSLLFLKFFYPLNLEKKLHLKNEFKKFANFKKRISQKNAKNRKFIKISNKKHNKKKFKPNSNNFFKTVKNSFIQKDFHPFLKKQIKLIKFFSYLSSPSSFFINSLNRNAFSFLKSIYFWYFFNFKNSLLGYFFNELLLINSKFSFIYFFLSSGAFNAALICKYITTRLHQGVLLFDIIKPLIFKIISFERTSGFKISCAGRFSRKQIAAYSWQLRGELPLNSFGRIIDYYHSSAFLNNSVCGLKVWLCFPEKSLLVKRKGFFFSGRSFCL